MTIEESKDQRTATVWIDNRDNTRIDLKLDDLFKLLGGKEITIKVNSKYGEVS